MTDLDVTIKEKMEEETKPTSGGLVLIKEEEVLVPDEVMTDLDVTIKEEMKKEAEPTCGTVLVKEEKELLVPDEGNYCNSLCVPVIDKMDKRERGYNFSEKEKELLFSIIAKHLGIIENKKTNRVTVKEKRLVWMKIADAFNASTQEVIRSASQLKNAYMNFKRKIRRGNTEDKAEFYKPQLAQKINDNKSKLLELLKTQMEPIVSEYDSSANYLKPINDTSEEILILDPLEVPIVNLAEQQSTSNVNLPNRSTQSTNCSTPSTSTESNRQFKKKRTIADVYDSVKDFTENKKNKIDLDRKKVEIELEILKMKMKREEELEGINSIILQQEKLKLQQEEKKLKQEIEKTKQEILKRKALEKYAVYCEQKLEN